MAWLFGHLTVLTVLIQVSTSAVSSPAPRCPLTPGWLFDSGTRKCIKIIPSVKTWIHARRICQEEQGDLINWSGTQPNFLISPDVLRENHFYWIGANDRFKEGDYGWLNNGTAASNPNWAPGQPPSDSEHKDCVAAKRNHRTTKWHNFNCRDALKAICMRPSNDELESQEEDEQPVTCQANWIQVNKKRKCIRIFENKAYDWLTASDDCSFHHRNAKLLDLDDIETNDFFFGRLLASEYWIAVNDMMNEGEYRLGVRRNAPLAKYLPWTRDPNRGEDDDCAVLKPGRNWGPGSINVFGCHISKRYICQYIPPAPPREKVCPAGWTKFTPQQMCIKVMGQRKKMWQPARESCKAIGGDLVNIPNQARLDFIKGLATASRYWIGLNDHNHDGKFTWLNQTAETTLAAWNNPPRNIKGDEYCVELIGKKDGKWNDKSCSAKRHFICQRAATYPATG